MTRSEDMDSRLRHELGLFFHRELDARYDPDYLQAIPEVSSRKLLDAVRPHQLDRLKRFFTHVMYPVGPRRERQDRHIETSESVLTSTSAIIHALPRLPGLVLRHGAHLSSVSRAGREVISAYRSARDMEDKVLDVLKHLCEQEGVETGGGSDIPEELLRRAYGSLDEDEIEHMIAHTEKTARLGSDRRLINATVDTVAAIRAGRSDPEEAAALEYVQSVVEDVRGISEEFSAEQIDRILELSGITERHYFGNLPHA